MADPHNSATSEADADAQAYLRGSQEINEQRATFDLFMGLAKWGSLAIACVLTWLTIWFMPNGSLFAGFITAAVLAVAGFFFLKSPKKAH